jgi:hypothetical protein
MKSKNLGQIVGSIMLGSALTLALPQNARPHDLDSPFLHLLGCYSAYVTPIDDDSKYFAFRMVAGVDKPSKDNTFSLKVVNENGEVLFSTRSAHYVESAIAAVLKSDAANRPLDVYTIVLEPHNRDKIEKRFTVIYNNGKSIIEPVQVLQECV